MCRRKNMCSHLRVLLLTVALASGAGCAATHCPPAELSSRFSSETPSALTQEQAVPLIDAATRHIMKSCNYKLADLLLLGVVQRDGREVVQIMCIPASTGYDFAVEFNTNRVLSFRAWEP